MAFSEIVQLVGKVFAVDPLSLKIMRVDLYADIVGYSVNWFYQNARVKRKRHTEEYGHFRHEHREMETLYFGKRPSLIRVYDKIRHLQIEYRRLIKGWSKSDPPPTFRHAYGYSEEGMTVTRVERQYGGGRVPSQISTLSQLQQNGVELDPFEQIQFLPIAISDDFLNNLSGDRFLRAAAVALLIERHGFHGARSMLDAKSCRNSNRLFKQFQKSLGPQPELRAVFRTAIATQFAG